MSFLDKFMPKKVDFYKLLEEQAFLVLEGMKALNSFMESGDIETADKVIEYERDADTKRRIIIDDLNQTFITPIDREDIFSLSRAVDDIIDYGKSTVDEMKIYKVKSTPKLQLMTKVLEKATLEVFDSTKMLKEHPKIASEHAVKAKHLENQMEHIYHEALAELFEKDDFIYILKMREIYRHLSNSADMGDEAANIIGDIIVKMG